MSWTRLFVLLLVLYVAYLFYVPTPDDIDEKFKYRAFCAVLKFSSHMVGLHQLVFPGIVGANNVRHTVLKTVLTYAWPFGQLYSPDINVTEELFDGVKVRVYTPQRKATEGSPLPGFVYFHGGGMAILDIEFFDGLTGYIAETMNVVVVSVDYRRTPEHKFQVSYDDSFKATRWFLRHARQYGVDPKRVAIGGDSVGGYLTAAVTQMVYEDAGTPDIKLQILIYPWMQILDLNTPSYQKYRRDFGSGGPLSIMAMGWFSAMLVYGDRTTPGIVEAFLSNNHSAEGFAESALLRERFSHALIPAEYRDPSYYSAPSRESSTTALGKKIWAESKDIFSDPRLCPLCRKVLSFTPKTYIATVGYDPIRDDGIFYAKLLEKAGVDVVWRHYDRAFHPSVWTGPSLIFEVGREIISDVADYVEMNLYRRTPEHKFPVSYEDSFKATRWFLLHARQYGVDPKRVAIGGDSVGGYLTAAVTQMVYEDAGTPDIKLQILIYPWMQILDLNTPSYQKYRRDFGSGGPMSITAMGWFSAMLVYGGRTTHGIIGAFLSNNHSAEGFAESALLRERFSHALIPAEYRDPSYYSAPSRESSTTALGKKIWAESKDIFLDPRSCPLCRKDLSSAPKTYIVTVGHDPLRDDGIFYAKLLEQAGVNVVWRHYDRAFHGSVWAGSSFIFEVGLEIVGDVADYVEVNL